MKPVYISRLASILENPQHSALYGKNGVVYSKLRNERGFKESNITIPYTHFMGAIETSEDPIIFSTDGTNSAIGIYNVDEDTYTSILDDSTLPYKLNFNIEGYIQGEARRNYLNEIEIVWLDTHNVPRFLNLSKPIPTDLNLLKLFIGTTDPNISLSVSTGGGLRKGAYYVGVKYISNDTSELNYSVLQGPVFTILEEYGGIGPIDLTNKSLSIKITDLDTQYSKIQIAIISNLDGIVTVKELDEIPIPPSGEVNYKYSNNNVGTDITLEEVLIPLALYENAKAITQENDVLYLGNTQEKEYPDLQQYFMTAKINWIADIVDHKDPKIKSGEKRTLKHGEVYALYAVVKWKDGKVSDGYHIPGPMYQTNTNTKHFWPETATVPIPISYEPLVWRDQISSQTWSLDNPAINEGQTGGWVNTEEKYPNSDSFGLLKGTEVRHHRMPTMEWCRKNLVGIDANYGVNKMSILRLRLFDHSIPSDIMKEIDSIELYHAKRDFGNSLIFSQGVILPTMMAVVPDFNHPNPGAGLGNMKISYKEYLANITPGPNPIYNMIPPYFSGANIGTDLGLSNIEPRWVQPFSYVHAFFSPSSIKDKFVISGYPGIFVNGSLQTGLKNMIVSDFSGSIYRENVLRIIDSTLPRSSSSGGGTLGTEMVDHDGPNFSIGEESFYVVNNQIHTRVNNSKSESKLILMTVTDGDDLQAHWDYGSPNWEYINNVDLINMSSMNFYVQFVDQQLVRIGKIDELGLCEYGGDTFICDFSICTSGLGNANRLAWQTDGNGNPINKITNKFFRTFLIESNYNLWQRYEDPAIPTDRFHTANTQLDRDAYRDDIETNFISIPKSANAIADLLKGTAPFNIFDENVFLNPFKIIRSQRQQRENKVNSWRRFLGLDYFETIKDKGPIINLQGYNGNLLIHHKYAIYQTVSKTTLNGDILSVTLGTGDIFQLEPQEGRPSKTGIGGLQHPLYCAMTDVGYLFVDIEKRTVYKVDTKGLQPLNLDLDILFKESLKGIDGNPHVSMNGVTIGFDEEENRLLFSFLKNEESLTFSMDISLNNWSYSHDYFPNKYINTRNKLLNIKDNKLFRFNEGNFGVYHGPEVHPYYVDVVFIGAESFRLDNINWRTIVEAKRIATEYQDELFDKTFTSVTIWNANQCTGKIPLIANNGKPLANNSRSPEYRWNFNKFVNILKTPGIFLKSIYEDFEVDESKITPNIPWYQKDKILGDYVVVRFEFDNLENNQLTVLDLAIDSTKSYR